MDFSETLVQKAFQAMNETKEQIFMTPGLDVYKLFTYGIVLVTS